MEARGKIANHINWFNTFELIPIQVYRSRGKGRKKKLITVWRQRQYNLHLKGTKENWQ